MTAMTVSFGPFALPPASQPQLRSRSVGRPHASWHAARRAAAVPWQRRRRRQRVPLPTVTPAGRGAAEDALAGRGAAEDALAQAAKKPNFRLWSNLSPELRHEPGTVWGAAALITGTTVGAGILALPAKTAASGFVASSAALTAFSLFSIGEPSGGGATGRRLLRPFRALLTSHIPPTSLASLSLPRLRCCRSDGAVGGRSEHQHTVRGGRRPRRLPQLHGAAHAGRGRRAGRQRRLPAHPLLPAGGMCASTRGLAAHYLAMLARLPRPVRA